MAKNSKIEWTEHTFNPWWGCVRVSPACKHCYAETFSHRLGFDLWGKGKPRRVPSDVYWRQPLAWDTAAAQAGRRARVFCASMADVFEERDDLDVHRARLWALIAHTPNLDWLLLTKRPEHVGRLVPWVKTWPDNVWLGTTAETQRWADERVPELLKHPARIHFVSCEPLLGPVILAKWLERTPKGNALDWVIAGGESGHHARPTHPEWFRMLRDQCSKYGASFHFKQWGNWRPTEPDLVERHPSRRLRAADGEPIVIIRVGKKAAGRQLDGQEWGQVPPV